MKPQLPSRPALYGIIGHPLSHTLSPVMQQAALNARRIPAQYVAFDVPPAQLHRALQLLRRLRVVGVNVTVPYKERIMRHLDRVDRPARMIGAVNTVVRRGTRWIGHNTDAPGLAEAWRQAHVRLQGATVLLLGAGGAARAVMWTLRTAGALYIGIANRTRHRAAALQRWARRCLPGLRVTVVPWPARASWIAAHRPACVINTTSLGLRATNQLPVSLTDMPRSTVIYDLAYRRPTTAWVTAARRRGMLAYDGRSMLLYQGAHAFTLWTGTPAPLATMRRALEGALRHSHDADESS